MTKTEDDPMAYLKRRAEETGLDFRPGKALGDTAFELFRDVDAHQHARQELKDFLVAVWTLRDDARDLCDKLECLNWPVPKKFKARVRDRSNKRFKRLKWPAAIPEIIRARHQPNIKAAMVALTEAGNALARLRTGVDDLTSSQKRKRGDHSSSAMHALFRFIAGQRVPAEHIAGIAAAILALNGVPQWEDFPSGKGKAQKQLKMIRKEITG